MISTRVLQFSFVINLNLKAAMKKYEQAEDLLKQTMSSTYLEAVEYIPKLDIDVRYIISSN